MDLAAFGSGAARVIVIGGKKPNITCNATLWIQPASATPRPTDLRQGIERMLADGALRERVASRARDFVVADYAFDQVLKREVALLEELAA